MPPVSLHVRASVEDVWRVLGEGWDDVHRVLPRLSSSHLLTTGGLGVGAQRRCVLVKPIMGIERVEERLTAWEPGRAFTYVFDGPPWPMASVSNTWALSPDGTGTRLTLSPSLRMRGGVWTQWLAPALLWGMSRSLEADLPVMVEAIERECEALRSRPLA